MISVMRAERALEFGKKDKRCCLNEDWDELKSTKDKIELL